MHHIFLWRKWRRQEQKQHQPYQSWMGVEGSSLFLGGWRYQPAFPLYILHLEWAHFFPSFPNNICSQKARQVVRVDWSWMDFLSLSSLSMLLSLPFFSILQSPEASISLITESFHLNGRLCIVRTKGRAASEEVLDRGMDWAQRLGWVELQVQASLPEPRQLKEGLHSKCSGTFRDWEKRTCVLQLHSSAT